MTAITTPRGRTLPAVEIGIRIDDYLETGTSPATLKGRPGLLCSYIVAAAKYKTLEQIKRDYSVSLEAILACLSL